MKKIFATIFGVTGLCLLSSHLILGLICLLIFAVILLIIIKSK